jgi:salicylate 5-hydroxylase small subunit
MDAQVYAEICQLHAGYAAALSGGDWEAWPDFFTEDCLYRLIPRENHERGFPSPP